MSKQPTKGGHCYVMPDRLSSNLSLNLIHILEGIMAQSLHFLEDILQEMYGIES